MDLPFDDHLLDVTVPVLSMATAGGIGQYAAYSTSLGSTDVTTMVASIYPPEYQMIDFGHVDLFISDEARTLAWEPVLAWIVAHSGKEMKGYRFTQK